MKSNSDGRKPADDSVAELTPPSQWIRSGMRSDGAESAPPGTLGPGQVFAGRYRMIERIGRGGMGEVWRAIDQVLQTPVAIKLIRAGDEDSRERLLKEVRLARQITHPSICRVFDVGESDDHVFYSMELVDGEDLATLLRHVGRLPPEKAVDIGLQLCAGVEAAHQQGVLHRDLKPANVLIDADGQVRITDFGIAILRNEHGLEGVIGTPGYMAPEQRTPGRTLTERTDVYALCVILYELLVGEPPLNDGTSHAPPPDRPSLLVSEVGPALERVILRGLAADPALRPASAETLAAQLRQLVPATPGGHSRRVGTVVTIVAAMLFVAAAVAGVWWLAIGRSGGAAIGHDTIVLADFVNTTGEPVFDGALKVALAVALEQSPYLRIFPDQRVRETLLLLEQPPDARVTRAIARDIARREQLKALVAGSITSLGQHYVVTLEAVDAESGEVVAREQAEILAKEQVLRAIGDSSSRLREKLGESLASVRQFDVPLPRATTSSLDALHAYAQALDQGRENPRREAIPYLKRALELDPDFAMAQALLSGVYANTGQTSMAPEFSRRAFALRNRVSERERFFISWRYYIDAAQSWDRALDLAASWTATYPREAMAFNSLAMAASAFGQHVESVQALRTAMKLDPGFTPPYGNLIGALTALNRFGEAKSLLRETTMRGIDGTSIRRATYVLAFLDGDQPAMSAALTSLETSSSSIWSAVWQARSAAFEGRFMAAHDLYARGVALARRDGLRELAAQWTAEDAELHALAGQCPDARREAADAFGSSRDNFTLERGARVLALCRESAQVDALRQELSERYADATLTTRLQLPLNAAVLAWRRGEPAQAVARLAPVEPYDLAPSAELWPAFVRGESHLQLRDGRAAAAQFRVVTSHRGVAPASPLYPLAQLGLARAAVLEGRQADARAAYTTFFELWKNADRGLPMVGEAQREYAAIR